MRHFVRFLFLHPFSFFPGKPCILIRVQQSLNFFKGKVSAFLNIILADLVIIFLVYSFASSDVTRISVSFISSIFTITYVKRALNQRHVEGDVVFST